MNETHNLLLTSWVASANDPQSDFPIQNLPLGVFKRIDREEQSRIGVAIGDSILDLRSSAEAGLLDTLEAELVRACGMQSLNSLMALGYEHWSLLRKRLSELLRSGAGLQQRTGQFLLPMRDAHMLLPAEIGDYTDFYASIVHATNVGSMFRPDNPLLPNYKFVPIGYHGRASSIVVSGTPFPRPSGQTKDDSAPVPEFGPSRQLDYELEIGAFVGSGNTPGQGVKIDDAGKHIFGLCVLNDWSARDIQRWEYQPLGPFLAKNFATTISPWIVTTEALEPFRVAAFARPPGDPEPLPYLHSSRDREVGGFNITLEVFLLTQRMRDQKMPPLLLSRGNVRDLYWTIAQMFTHHASNGCNLRPGDLLGSGTISGASKQSRGCLLELTWRGSEPLQLPSGEQRKFLRDGDEVLMKGFCEANGARRIGFGECRGLVLPAAL